MDGWMGRRVDGGAMNGKYFIDDLIQSLGFNF